MASQIKEVKLSTDNSKMGRVLHVNLPPIRTCSHELPCYKNGCYSRKAWQQYPEVRKSWMHNWKMYKASGPRYFMSISRQIRSKRKLDVFRWHSSGDIPDTTYLQNMFNIAHCFPEVKFLAFTKKYDLLSAIDRRTPFWRPDNLTITLSGWPGLPLPLTLRKKFPVAWMHDEFNPDRRIPKRAKKCTGKCETCLLCWELKPGEAVVFDKH